MFINIAASERQNDVSGSSILQQVIVNLLKSRYVFGVVRLGIDARNHVACMNRAVVLLPAGVNIGHKHFVRAPETVNVFGEERSCAGEAVALENNKKLFVRREFRRDDAHNHGKHERRFVRRSIRSGAAPNGIGQVRL